MGSGHIGIILIIISVSLITIPVFAQDPCSDPDGYCMDKFGMNDPENYSSCLANVIAECEEKPQPTRICYNSIGKEITFSKYTPIEDYDLVYELVLQGFNEKNIEADKILVDNYKGTSQYESECVNIYKEYKQIGKESKIWRDECTDLDLAVPHTMAENIREMFSILNGVCRFADLSSFAQTVEEPKTKSSQKIVCGKGTIEKNGQCVPERATMTSEMQQKSSNGVGCLIATATFGSELAPQVQQLRELRDDTLLQTKSGSAFMTGFNEFYYSFSPTIADWERQNPVFKEVVRLAITPLITSLSILNYVDMDSEAEVLGYGIGIILLNIGMYFAVPLLMVTRLKRRF